MEIEEWENEPCQDDISAKIMAKIHCSNESSELTKNEDAE